MDTRDWFYRRWTVLAPLMVGAGVALLVGGERVRGILLNTLYLASSATAIALPLGVLVAGLLIKTNVRGRRGMLVAWRVLLFVPLFVHVAGWQAGFGVDGWLSWSSPSTYSRPLLDGWRGAIWIHAMVAVPWVVCIVAAGLASTPASPEEAASLVASPLQVLWSITLPAAVPSMALAAAWVFLLTASEMTVTDFFQIRTFAEEIYTQESMGGAPIDNPGADEPAWERWPKSIGLVAGTMLLAGLATLILTSIYGWLRRGPAAIDYHRWQIDWQGARGAMATLAAFTPLLLVAGLPVAGLIYKAGLGSHQTSSGWVREWSLGELSRELAGALPGYHRELTQSLWVGLSVASLCVAVGVLLAWRLRQARRLPVVWLGLFALVMATPGPLLGLFVIRIMNHPSGSPLAWMTTLYDDTIAPWVLVQSIRYVGLTTLVILAGMTRVPATLLEAARVDGAGWLTRLGRVVLPLSWPSVVAAWLLTLALSVADLSASVVVAPPMTPTLTIQIFRHLHYGADDRVAAISLVLLTIVSVVVATGMWIWGRNRSRG